MNKLMVLFFCLVSVLVSPLTSSLTLACNNGDTSKVLLVLAVSEDGEQDKVVGEIKTVDHSIRMTSASYHLVSSTGGRIVIESMSGRHISFDVRNAVQSHFCYAAIFGE